MYGSQTCADVEGVRAIPDHDMCSEATQDMAISDDISCSYSGASCDAGQDESSEVSSSWQKYDVSGCFEYGSTYWNPKSGNRFKCDSSSYFVSISNCCLFFLSDSDFFSSYFFSFFFHHSFDVWVSFLVPLFGSRRLHSYRRCDVQRCALRVCRYV